MNEPMPSLATSLGPKTSQDILGAVLELFLKLLAKPCAAFPNCVGVLWLAGRLAHSFANSTPAMQAWACLNSAAISLPPLTATTTWRSKRGSGLDLVLV